ncbi:hypothetical protein DPMN_009105 [Dreissena polymorpha]|uniref:Uncharacterized protein n=1 Tax=Dreissena polymorpha TaxID=45954 RepID=A0A9D4MZY0_DREPO|nr:hypothetical protein DPMN_009104 [Dreissena polymorpha]KAH3885116.1 hypothetical protein DPMN_009105 [Dreissena polymorpha]
MFTVYQLYLCFCQDLSNASSLVNDSGDDHTGDPGLEMQVKELQQRVVQLEQELLDRDAVIRDLQAKVLGLFMWTARRPLHALYISLSGWENEV